MDGDKILTIGPEGRGVATLRDLEKAVEDITILDVDCSTVFEMCLSFKEFQRLVLEKIGDLGKTAESKGNIFLTADGKKLVEMRDNGEMMKVAEETLEEHDKHCDFCKGWLATVEAERRFRQRFREKRLLEGEK